MTSGSSSKSAIVRKLLNLLLQIAELQLDVNSG